MAAWCLLCRFPVAATRLLGPRKEPAYGIVCLSRCTSLGVILENLAIFNRKPTILPAFSGIGTVIFPFLESSLPALRPAYNSNIACKGIMGVHSEGAL